MTQGELSEEQMRKLAKQHGHKLTKKDLDTIEKMKNLNKEKRTKEGVQDYLDEIKDMQNGQLSKEDFMKAIRNGNLSKEEIRELALLNNIELTPVELEKVAKEAMNHDLDKDRAQQDLDELKQANGGKLTKQMFMEELAKKDLSPEEIAQLARENGIVLSQDEINAIHRGKLKTKDQAEKELEEKLRKKGKLTKKDFADAVKGADMTKEQILELA